MGFLNGAYGKLMAGKLVRDLQYQMTSVQSRLRRVTREIGQKEKMYQAQERNMKQAMQSQMQAAMWGYMGISPMDMRGLDPATAQQLFGNVDSTKYSFAMQMVQTQYATAQNVYQQMFEMQREADLQALKDLEEDLQTEKDNLESRLQIAKQEYDAKKEEEKDGAKGLQPNYTGQ